LEPRQGGNPRSQQTRPADIRLPLSQQVPTPISRSSPLTNVNSRRVNHNAENMTPSSTASHSGSDALFAATIDDSPQAFGSDPGSLLPDDQEPLPGSYPGTPTGSESWVEQSLPKPRTRVDQLRSEGAVQPEALSSQSQEPEEEPRRVRGYASILDPVEQDIARFTSPNLQYFCMMNDPFPTEIGGHRDTFWKEAEDAKNQERTMSKKSKNVVSCSKSIFQFYALC
jgi:hypothetical protein